MKSFASDNYSGVAPEIMQAIIEANQGHQPSYGNDIYTQQAEELLRKTFGEQIKSFFVYNGTGDEIQICYDNATYWGHHASLPKVVTISQSTELGTIYTPNELRAISTVCKKNKLIFHMDGCRLSNAAAALNCSLAETTSDVGVDVLSFGGTKNGLMIGEAVIFLNPELADEFAYIHKQYLQLNSKMRFISAQFIPYLKDKLWHRFASHANKMAGILSDGLLKLKDVTITYPVETNQVFACLPEKMIQATIEIYPFYIRDKKLNQVRFVTSFDTTEKEIGRFTDLAKKC
ncbi:MAG: beta-eliminating lyase-related protein [Gammaproteobacteria bacterium]|nr:beta-eliminating lyase-related protein [Gammaproteobacteria bacterium]